MARIKWVGIVDDLSAYQRGRLAAGARKLEMPPTEKLMIKALPFAAPSFLIIFLSMFIKTNISGRTVIHPVFVFLGFGAGVLCTLLHELLHAAVYPKDADVYIGIYPKGAAAVALASYPLSRPRFVTMSLLPLVLGIVPIAVFWFLPADMTELNGLMFGMAVMGLMSPYPDIYNIYQVMRQTPKKCRVQFFGDDLYCVE